MPTDEITFESFSMLSALAMATRRVRLGHMVVCTGFRNPGLTAKLASTIDVISGGRFELGIGAGWKEDEWLAYGYGFPSTGERLAQFADHLEVITRMLGPGHATYEGERAQVKDAINVPKGIQHAHPGHRRRQRPRQDRGPRSPVRRRAQLRVPAAGRDPRAHRRGAGEVRDGGPGPVHAALLAVRPRRGACGRRARRAWTTSAELAEIGSGADRLLPGRWDPTTDGQASFAEDCRAAGFTLAG